MVPILDGHKHLMIIHHSRTKFDRNSTHIGSSGIIFAPFLWLRLRNHYVLESGATPSNPVMSLVSCLCTPQTRPEMYPKSHVSVDHKPEVKPAYILSSRSQCIVINSDDTGWRMENSQTKIQDFISQKTPTDVLSRPIVFKYWYDYILM